jgi:hypothetical protein
MYPKPKMGLGSVVVPCTPLDVFDEIDILEVVRKRVIVLVGDGANFRKRRQAERMTELALAGYCGDEHVTTHPA